MTKLEHNPAHLHYYPWLKTHFTVTILLFRPFSEDAVNRQYKFGFYVIVVYSKDVLKTYTWTNYCKKKNKLIKVPY